jgi:protein tyrosine phosphatase (PTP) superfamily phosphohydrolase (DUF442 family)
MPKVGLRLWKTVVLTLIACALGSAWEFRRPWFQGNLGIVDPGVVIRTAQPTSKLAEWATTFQLKSILNLRGGNAADWWYVAEVKTAQERGLAYYDVPMSATRRPTRHELLRLIDILESCPYPLLIHCKSGADRTGLASALYLMVQREVEPETAENSFSLEYGHVPIAGTQHLHEPLDEYAQWLKENKLPHTAKRFREWVKNDYRSDEPHTDPPRVSTGPRASRS